jgi:hypothetical protein
MDRILDLAATTLARNPAPALPLEELFRLLKDDAPGVALSVQSLLAVLSRSPERFRVVRAAPGWRRLLGTMNQVAGGQERPSLPARHAPIEALAVAYAGPWIIGFEAGVDAGRSPPRPLRTLRATVAYLGRRLDGDSAVALARWLGLLAENGRLRDRLDVAGTEPAWS